MRIKWGPVFCQAVEASDEEEKIARRILRAYPAGYQFNPRYKMRDAEGNRLWDGYKSLVSEHGRFLTGLLPRLQAQGNLHDLVIQVEGTPEPCGTTTPIPANYLNDGVSLFPWQIRMIEAALRADTRGILKGATRSGKTRVMSALAKFHHNKSILILVNSSDLFDQLVEEITKHLQEPLGSIRGWSKWDEKRVTVAMVQTLYKYRYKPKFEELAEKTGVVMLDECLPAGTLVGNKAIETYVSGDFVESINHQTGQIEKKTVLRVFKRHASRLIRLQLANGTSLSCTPNHPILVKIGNRSKYITSENLTCGSILITRVPLQGEKHVYQQHLAGNLSSVPETIYKQFSQEDLFQALRNCTTEKPGTDSNTALYHMPETGPITWTKRPIFQRKSSIKSGLLLYHTSGLMDGSRKTKSETYRQAQKDTVRENDTGQPYTHLGCEGENRYQKAPWRVEASCSWGKWKRTYHSAAPSGLCTGLENGGPCIAGTEKTGLPNILQNRHWKHKPQSCNRSGWGQPLLPEGSRQEERLCLGWTWVESIEIQELGGLKQPPKLSGPSFVYNLEVADNNNYFANGILVHNCQCASAESVSKVLEKIPTRHRIFLSGTPLNKDEYRNSVAIGLSGYTISTVTSAELKKAGRISTAHIFPRSIPPATDEEVLAHPPPGNPFTFKGDHDLKDLDFFKARAIMRQRNKLRLAYYQWAFLWGVENNPYVKWIIRNDCEWYVEQKFPTWIPVDTKRHGLKLLNLLGDFDAVFLDRDDKVATRTAERKAFNEGKRAILISTPIFNVGIDFPSLKAIIPAGGGKAIDELLQILGRGQMVKSGSNTYYVTDFKNRWNYKLLEHSIRREHIYRSTKVAVIHRVDEPLTLLEE